MNERKKEHNGINTQKKRLFLYVVPRAPTICKHSLFIYVSVCCHSVPLARSYVPSARSRSLSIRFACTISPYIVYLYGNIPAAAKQLQYIQNVARYSLILNSCACSARNLPVSFWAASREFGVQVYLVVSAIHDKITWTMLRLSLSLSVSQMHSDELFSIAASKAQAKYEPKKEPVTNKRKHICQSLLHFIFGVLGATWTCGSAFVKVQCDDASFYAFRMPETQVGRAI